jgi:hypothetical protein
MQRKCVDRFFGLAAVFALCATAPVWAQRGFGGGPGDMGQTRKILKTYNTDGNGYLNAEERKAARADRGVQRGGRGGFGGRGAASLTRRFLPLPFIARAIMHTYSHFKSSTHSFIIDTPQNSEP